MNIAIVTTGDEIMAGNVVDTNAAWMSELCWNSGAKVVWRVAVGDDLKEIGQACRLAAKKSDVVLVSGGLGPTVDDITLEAAAKAFGKKMEFHPEVFKEIENFFKRVGRPIRSRGVNPTLAKVKGSAKQLPLTIPIAPSNRKQAFLPEGGVPIPNKVGTAPGCQIRLDKAAFFFLPGVPKELYPMFEDFVLPWIREQFGGRVFYQEKILHCFGTPEASLDTMLKGVHLGNVRLSFRVRFPEVLLKLAFWGGSQEKVEKALEDASKNVYERVGEYIYGEGETNLAKVVGELLVKRSETLSVAESCTGGAIADWITNVSGASKYFERGVVVYSNRSKKELLHVKRETMEKFGTVSEVVAKEMAEGIRRSSNTTYGLAVTGIAGPTGGTKEKPVGTVYIALATPKEIEAKHFCFQRNRIEFKQLVTATALNWLRRVLQG